MINVALVVKPTESTQARGGRNMGYWSYPVPEFKWQHFPIGGKAAYATDMTGHDIIFQEDAGPYYLKRVYVPRVYLAIDSTLSEDHLKSRIERAKDADLVLVDHGPLEDFDQIEAPVRRFNYCVNDHLFRDYGYKRDIDVSFHCAGNGLDSRRRVRVALSNYCDKNGHLFTSGILHLPEYAKAMAQSKIVVNWPRVSGNRPHRIFDALACGACLVTGPIPDVPGDNLLEGRDYIQVETPAQILAAVDHLLTSGEWQQIGHNGKKRVERYHTWAIRAKQLDQILREELDIG